MFADVVIGFPVLPGSYAALCRQKRISIVGDSTFAVAEEFVPESNLRNELYTNAMLIGMGLGTTRTKWRG
jgi:hypothetical protein